MLKIWSLYTKAKNLLFITYVNAIYNLLSKFFQPKPHIKEKNLGIEIINSGLLGAKNWNHAYSLAQIRQSHHDLNSGRYFDGIQNLISFHESLYEMFADSNGNFYPPFLSREWTNAFGHIPNIGSLIKMKEKGLVEKIPSRAILSSGYRNLPILKSFGHEISFVPDLEGKSTWSQLPSFLHLFLGQNIIWTKKLGFVPFEWLMDKLYRDYGSKDPIGLQFDLPLEYVYQSKKTLGEIGFFDFSEDEWFITLHVRNSGDETSKIRNFEIDSFQEVIEEVGRRGGKVVRICKEAKPTLPKRDFVLDCANFPDRLQKFHLFFIANSKVFVGTPSGPYNYPRIFGTPSLVANMTNIGRACFPSSSYQEYLPMRFYRDTRELSLAKLLESPAGWADCSERDLANLNLQPIPNTPREIMEAFVHLLDRVESKQVFEESHLQIRARELRSKFTWTSTGNISETFLRDNQNWLI